MALSILAAAGLNLWAQNESDRTKSRQLTTASIRASVQTGRETSAAIQSQTERRSWAWQTESEADPPQRERLSLEASFRMLQGKECDQPALCSQGDVMLPCPWQMHSLPCLDLASVCLHWLCSHQGQIMCPLARTLHHCHARGKSPILSLVSAPSPVLQHHRVTVLA